MRKQFSLVFILVLLSFIVINFAQNVERRHDPVLEKVQNYLEPVFKTLDPKASIEYARSSKSLIIRYNTRKFMVHNSSKSGIKSLRAYETSGPAYNGFMLEVHLQEAGTTNQALVPQKLKRPYWMTDLDVTQISGTTKQIYWALSCGSRMDMKILSHIKAAIKKLDTTKGVQYVSTNQEIRASVFGRRDELTGIFKTNVKALSPYLLKIEGGRYIGLRGDILKNIPDGTRIWIRGKIHSTFYDNSNDPSPAMAPRQWHIFMDVETYEKIDRPFGFR